MELCKNTYTYGSIKKSYLFGVIFVARYSDAQKEATARYNKKAYDRIDVVVPKGKRQVIKDFAASQGKSLNRFICDAIEYQMNKEKETE